MSQCWLDTIYTLHKNVFQLAGAFCLHVSQRHSCEFGKPLFSDISQHRKGRLVGLRCGQ